MGQWNKIITGRMIDPSQPMKVPAVKPLVMPTSPGKPGRKPKPVYGPMGVEISPETINGVPGIKVKIPFS